MSLSEEGMDGYEQDEDDDVSIVSFNEKMYYESDIHKKIQMLRDFVWNPSIGCVCEYNCNVKMNNKINELFGERFKDNPFKSSSVQNASEDKA